MLGGTQWLGGEVARAALAAGHHVTCLARGSTVPSGARMVRADRDDDQALAAVAGRRWDAVIDLATAHGHVRRAARDLAHADRYVFVSTASVYRDLSQAGITEDAPTYPPLDAHAMDSMEQYGAAKVSGERAVIAAFEPDRFAVVRPGLIGGPGDPSGRTTYWPLRFARPANGSVLVPAAELPTSVIDVRDLAAFLLALAEGTASGTFNAVGRSLPLSEHLRLARAAAGHDGPLLSAPDDWLIAHGVNQWAGPRSLPLWLHDAAALGLGAIDNSRALAAGLSLRPLADTLRDILAWAAASGIEAATGSGLTASEERELLAALTSSFPGASPPSWGK